ncbi:MAG: mechanosensitive ion channel family protein, partial [Candidatus Angelobacter sp.]
MTLATTMAINFVLQNWKTWVWAAAGLAGAILLALIVHYLFFLLIKRFARRTSSVIDDSLVRHSEQPTRWIFPLIAILLAVPLLPVRQTILAPLQHALGLGVIASVAWVVILLVDVFTDAISAKYAIDVVDNLTARQIQTQAQVLRRIFVVVVVLLTLGIMLMTFPAIRTLGTSLLASAGLAGLVLGMAMRPTLASLVAGIQIALTQPIRIEDVVIIEGEWGWIEEIRTTYVVVRIWDLRRLVVPITCFIEKPFQNWTRNSAQLLGSVFLWVDYSFPLEEGRKALERIIESSPLWDRRFWNLQVTDTSERTMQLRVLATSEDSSKSWDLRCEIREKFIAYIQEHHPRSLPFVRAQVLGIQEAAAPERMPARGQ